TPPAKLGAPRRRPPPAPGVRVLARRAPATPHGRLPPRGARRLSVPASTRVWGGRSRPPRARDNSRAAPTARGSAPLGAGLHPRLGWAFSPAARPGQLTGGSHRAGLGAGLHPRLGWAFSPAVAPGTTHARLPPRGARRLSAQAHPHWG